MTDNNGNPTETNSSKLEDGELSILDLISVLYEFKAFIITFSLAASLAAVTYSLSVTPLYKAETLLFPAEENHSGGLQGSMGSSLQLLMPQLSGNSNEVSKYISILESNIFLSKFIKKNNLKPLLFNDEWNELESKWKSDEPSDSKSYRVLKGTIEVEKEAATGLIRMSVTWHDKFLASSWANEIVSELNNHIRFSDIEDTKLSLKYLEEEITKTNLKVPQNVLYNISSELTTKMMMANTRDEYAFKVIDYATPPDFRFSPQRTTIVILAGLFSFLLACILSIVINAVRNTKTN